MGIVTEGSRYGRILAAGVYGVVVVAIHPPRTAHRGGGVAAAGGTVGGDVELSVGVPGEVVCVSDTRGKDRQRSIDVKGVVGTVVGEGGAGLEVGSRTGSQGRRVYVDVVDGTLVHRRLGV